MSSVSVSATEFDVSKIKASCKQFMSFGREGSQFIYDLRYGDTKVGVWIRGRHRRTEHFNEAFIGQRKFTLPAEKEQLIDAIKKRVCGAEKC